MESKCEEEFAIGNLCGSVDRNKVDETSVTIVKNEECLEGQKTTEYQDHGSKGGSTTAIIDDERVDESDPFIAPHTKIKLTKDFQDHNSYSELINQIGNFTTTN